LREDKPPNQVRREESAEVPTMAQQIQRASAPLAAQLEKVRFTHPTRVMYPDAGVTKTDVAAYYAAVADYILPHVTGRPLTLMRCPKGLAARCFYQKHAPTGLPDTVEQIPIVEDGNTEMYLAIHDLVGLLTLVQFSMLELHVWGSRTDTLEQPDRMVFDFDPDEGLPFAMVRDAAKDMRDRLNSLGLESFAMATGGKGIHVVVPLAPKHSWDEHKNFAEALARLMEEEEPERFVANMSKAKRKGRIFVDYLRNGRGATAISPYSTRSRAGAYVATPVSWPQLARLKDARPATIKDAKKLLKADPWPDYDKVRQTLPLDRLL
jgi:bifunctional non-homologous end joining protein LigD